MNNVTRRTFAPTPLFSSKGGFFLKRAGSRAIAITQPRYIKVPFLTVCKQYLFTNYHHNQVLIDIYKPRTSTRGRPPRPSQRKKVINLTLPFTFESFLDTSKAKAWRAIFENPEFFKATTQKGNNVGHDLYIGTSRALSSIFYLLQILAPGMFVIYHEYRLPGEIVKVSRMLPRLSWIQRNDVDRMLRMEVMGSTAALLTAAKDQTIAFHEERTARPHYNLPRSSATTTTPGLGYHNSATTTNPGLGYHDSGNNYISTVMEEFNGTGYDWTACDKDCAWCGRCSY